MTHNEIITRNRNRIVNGAMTRLRRKTGGNLLIIKLPNKEIETIEVTESYMTQLLMRFEGVTRDQFGRVDGNAVIKQAYENAISINRDTEYLTDSGKLIVDELLNEVIEYVKNKHASKGSN